MFLRQARFLNCCCPIAYKFSLAKKYNIQAFGRLRAGGPSWQQQALFCYFEALKKGQKCSLNIPPCILIKKTYSFLKKQEVPKFKAPFA